MNKIIYVYSESLDEMVIACFDYHGKHYEWNDSDCVYYNVDTDEDYYMEVPRDVHFVGGCDYGDDLYIL